MQEESTNNAESPLEAALRIEASLQGFPTVSRGTQLEYYQLALQERQVRAIESIAENLEILATAMGSR